MRGLTTRAIDFHSSHNFPLQEDAFQAQMKQTMKKNLELEDSNQQLQTVSRPKGLNDARSSEYVILLFRD